MVSSTLSSAERAIEMADKQLSIQSGDIKSQLLPEIMGNLAENPQIPLNVLGDFLVPPGLN